MGRIFISAGHGGMESGGRDPGAIAGGTTEAEEMIRLRDIVVPELRSRGYEVLSVPDQLSLRQTIQWINDRARFGDVALEIHADAFSNPNLRGASAFYIFNNTERKKHAELMLRYLITRLPELPNRGAKPDTDSGVGRLAFCRDVILPSLLLEVGFLTNPQDRALLQNRRRDMARGIVDGLAQWSSLISGEQPPDQFNPVYPIIDIKINNQTYDDRGVLINSNSYIPIDLADRLGVDLTTADNVRRVQYRGVVYVKAIEVREYNIFVGWDAATRTVILRSISQKVCPGLIDRIMGHGSTSEVQLQIFLKNNNQNGLTQFPDLPRLYREEASVEGVNYDIAFAQACVETNFLLFSDRLRPEQNNFGGLGAVTSEEEATFSSARIGVRAHIQHLKAYASQEPLVQPLVDPRFRFVTRGIAPLVGQLSGRWSADLDYGKRIIAVVRRLYEASNLL